jgi:hypothetical protein
MTNKNIEELFKQALDGHELPYDASAWNSLNNKLNQNSLVGRPKIGRWILGSVAMLIICSLAIWKIAPNTSNKEIAKEIKQTSPIKTTDTDVKKDSPKVDPKQDNKNGVILPNINENDTKQENNQTSKNQSNDVLSDNTDTHKDEKKVDGVVKAKQDSENIQLENVKMVFPTLSFNCVGDQTALSNINATDLVLVKPSNQQLILPAKSVTYVTIEEKGYYRIGTMSSEGSFNEQANQLVNESPALDFVIEELNYLNGIPTLPLSVKSSETTYSLYVNDQFIQTNTKKELEVYVFEKGSNKIMICSSNDLSCKTTITKTISVENDYNLLAVNAFDPFSNDNRKSTFMPFALLKRETPFTLIIIDPSDGGIVFSSSDASNAWDGNDKRNGKMVAPNKAFIWKVTISNPEQKEKQEYKGTIVRL